MCQFFSGIAFKNGDIHYNPMTDSHEDLIAELDLNDDGHKTRSWVRFEYNCDDLGDISKYKLRIDEQDPPSWCDKDFQEGISDKAKGIVSRMIFKDIEKKILIGGCWVLTGGSIIDRAVNVRIILMRDSSQVGKMWGSSQVGEMWGSSRVGKMWGSSQVGEMRDSSRVGEMWDSSRVGEMWESSQVGEMWGSSQVGKMWGSSQVGEMWGSSQIVKARPTTKQPKQPLEII